MSAVCAPLVLQELVCPRFSASLVCRLTPGLCRQPEPQLVSLGLGCTWFREVWSPILEVPQLVPLGAWELADPRARVCF